MRDAQPVGDIVIGGRLVNTGFMGTALAITSENKARFIETRRWKARDWSDYETVLCGGPRLVDQWRVQRGAARRRVPGPEPVPPPAADRGGPDPPQPPGAGHRRPPDLLAAARPLDALAWAAGMRSRWMAAAPRPCSTGAASPPARTAASPTCSSIYDSSAGYHHALTRLAPGLPSPAVPRRPRRGPSPAPAPPVRWWIGARRPTGKREKAKIAKARGGRV